MIRHMDYVSVAVDHNLSLVAMMGEVDIISHNVWVSLIASLDHRITCPMLPTYKVTHELIGGYGWLWGL